MNLSQAEQFRQSMLAKGAKSDGCTLAPEIGTPCCQTHDFLRRFLPDDPERPGRKITPLQADNLLFKCVVKKGKGIKAPLYWIAALIYWSAARLGHIFGFYR